VLAIGSASVVLVTFALTTLVDEPATAVTIVGIVGVSALIDLLWKRKRDATIASPKRQGDADVQR